MDHRRTGLLIAAFVFSCGIVLGAFLLYFREQHWSILACGILLWSLLVSGIGIYSLNRILAPLTGLKNRSVDFLQRRADQRRKPLTLRETTDWEIVRIGMEKMEAEIVGRDERLGQKIDQLDAVLEGMNEGVLAIDTHRNIILSNNASRDLLAIQVQQITGRNLLEICRLPQLHQLIAQVEESNQKAVAEFETTVAPRRIVTVRATPFSKKNADGLALVIHEVTELRQLETMRRDFFTNVSHELKTPLASIKAYAETLKLGAINDQTKNVQFVDQIELAADRLANQIRDLLHLSRVESGHYQFEIEPVSLAMACNNCIQRFESAAMQANVELIFETPDDDAVAMVDEEGLGTILDNLVGNAIRYTPSEGKVKLAIAANEEWSQLTVSDTGIGIALDQQERIFERFYRVDKSRSRDVGGTGLGLSIVKHMVQSFGGNIEIDSRLGKGSRFTVRLKRP